MSEHKLPDGKSIIQAVEELGKLLEYHVRTEFPLQSSGGAPTQAVDVAWFGATSDNCPLFIFEVESKVGTSMSANPQKVFSKDTRILQKPLFFFHLLCSGGDRSSHITDLKALYAQLNYRIYRLGKGEGSLLVEDILDQHRRIRTDIDSVALYHFFESSIGSKLTAAQQALRYSFRIGFSIARELTVYTRLAYSDPGLLPDFERIIDEERRNGWTHLTTLSSYLGTTWGVFPLCALMIRLSRSPDSKELWNRALLDWQNHSMCLPQISHRWLGDSRDYNAMLLGTAAPLVVLCAGIAGSGASFVREMADALASILSRLRPGWHGYQTAVWLCHLAARFGWEDLYDTASSFIERGGGIGEGALYYPPSWACDEAPREDIFPSGENKACPGFSEFSKRARIEHGSSPFVELPWKSALAALNDDGFMYTWSDSILAQLWDWRQGAE